MSTYAHHLFRQKHGLNPKEEYLMGVLEEFGDLKASTICTMARRDSIYTKGSCLDALERLRDEGLLNAYKASSARVSTFNMWMLSPRGKYYLQQLKDLYK